MAPKENTIQRKLVRIVLLISGAVLLSACATILTYEFLTFRQTTVEQASTLGKIIATNSTAALAFDNPDDAKEILSALKAEQSVAGAGLYNKEGKLFSHYPPELRDSDFPAKPQEDGYRFEGSNLIGVQPVTQGDKRLGTLYLKWDLKAIYGRFVFYGASIIVIMTLCLLAAAYTLSRTLRRQVSEPILALAETANAVSSRQDYSVRAKSRSEKDELGLLTDVFNHMLSRIQGQNTALKESEEALRKSEEQYRLLFESNPHPMWVCDLKTLSFLAVNDTAVSRYGYSRDEFLSMTIKYIRPAEHIAALLDNVGNLTPTNSSGTWKHRKKDGTLIDVEVIGHDIIFAGTRARLILANDITERKQAETKLQTQLSRMELLDRITRATGERQDLHSIFQVVIGSLEEDLPLDFGCICIYEPATKTLTVANVGSRSEALATQLAMTDNTLIPIDQNGLSTCVRGSLVYEPDIGDAVFTFPKRLASVGLRSFVAAPLPVKDKIFGVLIAARFAPHAFSSPDCEFIRHLGEHVALAAHQANLYSALQEAYDDLRQSQQSVMQQERLRALGQMASGIAHDINNAISPIALYTESLLEREPNLSARARNYLQITQQAIQDVAQTIARMREFYRQRETQLTLAPVQLNSLVSQVKDLTHARWSDMPQQRGAVIEMATDLTSELPPIMCVENEIREALVNLIFNAVDAMPEGGLLTIRTRAIEGHGVVHLEVCDTGTGMDDETKRRCLEPFFTTKGERGTGLGLAMVYGVIQRNNAEIQIDSQLGKGTTVRIVFPISASSAVASAPQTSVAPGQPLRILIVDDDPLLIKALRDTLEGDGHVVTAASGGQEGIEAFETAYRNRKPFSIVITDLGMPHVDGRKVSAAIKAISAKTPVILFTGWGQRLVAERDIPEHVDRVLSKPPKLHDLRAALAELTAVSVGRA
jgi:PAS domain S-box-containing protein